MNRQDSFVGDFQRLTKASGEKIPIGNVLNQVSQDHRDLATELAELTGHWNPVEIYTAGNFVEEHAKVTEAAIQGKTYNPRYSYNYAQGLETSSMDASLKRLHERADRLQQNSLPERLATLALLNAVRMDQATLKLIHGLQLGNDALVQSGLDVLYRPSNPELIADTNHALENLMINGRPLPSESARLTAEERAYLFGRKLTAEEQAAAFRWGLGEYEMYDSSTEGRGDLSRGFRVQVDPSASTMDIRDRSRQGPVMVIPTAKCEELSAAETCGLLSHEIGGHARQAMNGSRLIGSLGGGALRKPCEWTYEGLAKLQEVQFWEEYMGDATPILEPYYAAVIAVQDAERGKSFAQIVEHLTNLQLHIELQIPAGQSLPSAIDSTLRRQCIDGAVSTTYLVMRGHIDTANPGHYAMRKNLAYYGGYRIMQGLQSCGIAHYAEAAITSLPGLNTMGKFLLVEQKDLIQFKPELAGRYARRLLEQRRPSN